MRQKHILPAAAIAIVVLIQGLTIEPGTDWDGDYAAYIMHAQNLVSGEAYSQTGYIYNPEHPTLSPQAYPPGFPIVLAPGVAALGVDFQALKRYDLLIITFALGALAWLLVGHVGSPAAAAGVLMFGLGRGIWWRHNDIGSDMLFVGLTALILGLASRPTDDDSWHGGGLGLGVALALGYAVRTVGAVFVPTLIAADLLTVRKIRRRTWVACTLFFAWAALQALLVPEVGSYAAQIRLSPPEMWSTLVFYIRETRIILFPTTSAALEGGLALALLAAAITGLRVLPALTKWVVVLYFVFTMAILASWGAYQGERFLLPLLPPLFLLVSIGLDRATRRVSGVGRRHAIIVLAAGLFVYPHVEWVLSGKDAANDLGVESPEAEAFFEWIRNNITEDAVVVFNKPRIMALLGERTSVAPDPMLTGTDLPAFLDRWSAELVAFGPRGDYWSRDDLQDFFATDTVTFNTAYRSQNFRVYQLRNGPAPD